MKLSENTSTDGSLLWPCSQCSLLGGLLNILKFYTIHETLLLPFFHLSSFPFNSTLSNLISKLLLPSLHIYARAIVTHLFHIHISIL